MKVWKKLIAIPLVLVLSLGGILVSTPSIEAEEGSTEIYPTDGKREWSFLNELNKLRKATGLKELVNTDRDLRNSARSHAAYISLNGLEENPHMQVRSKPAFLNHTPLTRSINIWSKKLGIVNEIIGYNKGTQRENFADSLASPYERIYLLDPYMIEIGIGYTSKSSRSIKGYKDMYVVDIWSQDKLITHPVVYPYEDQKNVPIGYYANNIENPLEKFGIKKSGYVITYQAPYEHVKNFKAILTDSKGNKVSFFQEEDIAFILYPKKELKYSEKYTVTVKYEGGISTGDRSDKSKIEYKEETKTWSFTTESKPKKTTTKKPK